MGTTVVQVVLGIFMLRSLGVAVLGTRMPGFSLPGARDLSEDEKACRIRKLRRLSAVAAVLCTACLVALSAIDHYLQTHPHGPS